MSSTVLTGAHSRGRPLDRTVRVGCSGWQYAHWRGDFYPAELPTSRWFAHYALTFDTVEINNSFYRLPPEETFPKWREQAPPHFLYAVKASRFLTHMKKLKDPQDPLARFFDNAKELGPRLGPVLYQLPPRWPLNLERFEISVRSSTGGFTGRGRTAAVIRTHAWRSGQTGSRSVRPKACTYLPTSTTIRAGTRHGTLCVFARGSRSAWASTPNAQLPKPKPQDVPDP